MDDSARRRKLRRAYERGRLRWAMVRGGLAWPVSLSLLLIGVSIPVVLGVGGLLWSTIAFAAWWKSAAGRGALAGAYMGILPVGVGLVMNSWPWPMTELECWWFCSLSSSISGAIAGGWLVRSAAAQSDLRYVYAIASTVTGLMSVVIGCTTIGFGSLAGFTVGAFAVGLPTVAWLNRRALA